MSNRFSRLQNFNTAVQTCWIEVPELGNGEKPARICVKPASMVNKPYYNAVLRLSGKRARRLAQAGNVSVEDIIANRLDDAKLYPKHVIVNWEDVVEDDLTTLVEFSEDNAAELCSQLCTVAPQIFDRIRDIAGTDSEFYSEDQIAPDAVELAGNSQTGSSGS